MSAVTSMTRRELIAYQDSLELVFLRALHEIKPGIEAEVKASISGGLYIQTASCTLSERELAEISEYMLKMKAEDTVIAREEMTRDDALIKISRINREDLYRLIEQLDPDAVVKVYNLDGYIDVFYSELAESVGELEIRPLIKYRDGILLQFPHPEDPHKLVDESSTILYNAIAKQSRWNEMLGVRYAADFNEVVHSEKLNDIVLLSRALHEKHIVEMADEIEKKNRRVVLILGPSSSGKTTFAKKLILQMRVNGQHPLYLSTDDYFVERSQTPVDANGKLDFESVDAIDVKLFTEQIRDLLAGEEVDIPTFDFIEGTKVFGKRKTRILCDDPIVIEGIHAFNPLLIGGLDAGTEYKIYISPLFHTNLSKHNRIPATDIRLVRRIVRDARTRGHSAADTIRGWDDVRIGEEKNIFPFAREADIFFNTLQVYDLSVLKKYAIPLLNTIDRDQPEYQDAERLLRMFEYIDSMDNEMIGCDAIIREFIGGSVFE